jgi:hypothetical protein
MFIAEKLAKFNPKFTDKKITILRKKSQIKGHRRAVNPLSFLGSPLYVVSL